MSPIDSIPDDPAALRAFAIRLQAQLQSEKQRVSSEKQRADMWKHEYQRLAREAFGRRSERLDGQAEGQLTLFGQPEKADEANAAPKANAAPIRAKKKRRGGGGRSKLPAHLPRVEVTSTDDGPTTCACCGGDLVEIGEERSERLERIPAQYKVLVTVRKKRACPGCPSAGVITQPAPPFALSKSKYADGFIAQVLVDKFADNIPLRRQATRLARENIDVPIANLCRLVKGSAELLKHVVQVMADDLRNGPFLQGDGTGFPILEGSKNQRISGMLWVYTDGVRAVFEATKTHHGHHAATFMDGFQGVFLPDGAATYNEATRAEDIIRAGCWAHARRKFFDARAHHVHAFTALRKICDLFMMEREGWQLDAEGRGRLRQERAALWVNDFRAFLDEHLADKSEPRSPWYKALKYADNQWSRLTVFLDHPDVPVHNNRSELALRGPVTGRKNWLFAGSEGGAKAAAVHFSIIHSCMLAGVDPYAYLRDILHRLPDATPAALRQMTPKAWAEREKE